MLKKLYRALVIAFIGFSIVGWSYNSNWLGSWLGQWLGGRDSSLYSQLPSNLTFFKDYQNTDNLIGNYSIGSPTATFTRATDATHPTTYVDANGVIQLVTTADVPRFAGGYYDATGFHSAKGLYMEAAGTNLVPKSYTMNDATWTATNVTVADGATTDVAGGSNAASLTASAGNGTVLLTTSVTAQTYSVYIKRKTGTGKIYLTANGGTNYTEITVPATGWAKFSETKASASQKCGIKIETDTDAIYVYGNQFEANPYPTSFIPTTTAALTRNAEVLKYPIAGNRTAATETIAIKFMPLGGSFADDGMYRILTATDTKKRVFIKEQGSTRLKVAPNYTDDETNLSFSSTTPLINTSYVATGVVQHSSPYSEVYINGISEGTYITGDWTNNAWETYFYLGSNTDGTIGANCLIQSIAIFSRALSAGEVESVYNTMK
jgi:hypothetical protein